MPILSRSHYKRVQAVLSRLHRFCVMFLTDPQRIAKIAGYLFHRDAFAVAISKHELNIVKHILLTFTPAAIETLRDRHRRVAQRLADASDINA